MSQKSIPYNNQCMIPIIWKIDPASSTWKTIQLIITSFILILFPFLPTILINYAFTNGDQLQKYAYIDMYNLPVILNLDDFQFYVTATIITFMFFSFLIVIDITQITQWPESWNCKNIQCYYEMFAEPKRPNQFIGHLGNTLSNFGYFYTGIIVFISCKEYETYSFTNFLGADLLFGVQLILLAIFSVIWHASNAPISHYFDLWVMENCIVYLQIRYVGWGIGRFLMRYNMDIGGAITLILYLLFIYKNFTRQWNNLERGYLDGECPFSSRKRYKKKNIQIHHVCKFAMVPIGFFIPPMIILALNHTLGHIVSLNIALSSLLIGWSIRMFERWVMDGWWIMHDYNHGIIVKALLSPTAIFHVLTGITLLSGYIHARSLD